MTEEEFDAARDAWAAADATHAAAYKAWGDANDARKAALDAWVAANWKWRMANGVPMAFNGHTVYEPEKIALKTLIDPEKISAPDWAERAIAAWETVVDAEVEKTEEKPE